MPENPEKQTRILGKSAAVQRVYELIRRVASTPATVLLTGESETGKEVVARAIHEDGNPPGAPFVPVNCAAIPENLIEAELFGYQRGLPMRRSTRKGCLSWREEVRSFSTKSGSCLSTYRPNC